MPKAEKHTKAWFCEVYSISYTTLKKWIAPIIAKHEETFKDYEPNQRRFTPAQAEAIINHLGPHN